MNQKDREKMCPECEGRIALAAERCPYCGSAADPIQPEEFTMAKLTQSQDPLSSLYPPTYTAKSEEKKPSSAFKQADLFSPDKRMNSSGSPMIHTAEAPEQEEKGSFWSLLFLSVGSVLVLLGLLQLFFSEGGYLRLEWKSSYWFLYCLLGAPLFFFGFKKANALK